MGWDFWNGTLKAKSKHGQRNMACPHLAASLPQRVEVPPGHSPWQSAGGWAAFGTCNSKTFRTNYVVEFYMWIYSSLFVCLLDTRKSKTQPFFSPPILDCLSFQTNNKYLKGIRIPYFKGLVLCFFNFWSSLSGHCFTIVNNSAQGGDLPEKILICVTTQVLESYRSSKI